MNRLLTMSLVSLSLLTLNGCNDKDSNSGQTTNTVVIPNTATTTAKCETSGSSITSFQRIQMHYGLLRNQIYQTGESGGLLPLTVTSEAAAGSTTINVDSTTALVAGQLITYLGENLDYYVAEIASLTSTTITLTPNTALVSKVTTGVNVWNFYDEASNPNHFGHKAIADFSYRKTASIVAVGSTHVIIGDNWLNETTYTDRLKKRYPAANIINNSGDADGLCDLLADFDKDVAENGPQYVWISSSVNDNKVGVSQEDYKLRLQDLIAKVQGIGATAIVFDSVAGSASTTIDGAVTSQMLAYRYSTQVQDLYNESKTPEEEPVVVTPPTTEAEGTASCAATAEPIGNFTWVQMHYGLLKGQGFISDADGQAETQGLATYTVSGATSAGSATINVNSTGDLVAGQLVTYLETDGIYRVAKIESLTETQITLSPDGGVNNNIVSGVAAGENLWNFYRDPDHPNSAGSNAMADYGYASLNGVAGVTEATHVLFGDSWFTNDGFEERVRNRLPNANIINSAIGGYTLCDLLEKFDSDVTPNAPDYVWINSGVNDYFNDVSAADYKLRMQNLIAKVQSIGAVAVVFDA